MLKDKAAAYSTRGGLAVVGLDTLTVLYQGQVDELLLSASTRDIICDEEALDEAPANGGSPAQAVFRGREPHLVAADLLVTRARLSGARVTFIEDSALLAGVGGCGACFVTACCGHVSALTLPWATQLFVLV